MGDECLPVRQRAVHRGTAGMTLLEVLVSLALFVVILGVAMPRMTPDAYALWATQNMLLSDLRFTRAEALTKGDHFRFDVLDDTSWEVRRMRLVGGVWTPDGDPIRSRSMPAPVTFTGGTTLQFEFNTRGLLVLPGSAGTLTIHDNNTGHSKDIIVWPSGQVRIGS